MTLNETMALYRAAKEFMAVDPETYSWQTRSGMQIRRRQVEQEIASLRQAAKEALQEANGAVCFVGPATDLLAKAQKKGPVVAADASAIYQDIARAIERTLYPANREWTTEQTSMVGTEILTRMADINPYERHDLQSPGDMRPFVVGTGDNLVAVVRRVAREIYGDRLVGENMARDLLDGALTHDLDKRIPQLIVYGVGSEAEADALRAYWPFATIVDPRKFKK